jgi:hypothetical protein
MAKQKDDAPAGNRLDRFVSDDAAGVTVSPPDEHDLVDVRARAEAAADILGGLGGDGASAALGD